MTVTFTVMSSRLSRISSPWGFGAGGDFASSALVGAGGGVLWPLLAWTERPAAKRRTTAARREETLRISRSPDPGSWCSAPMGPIMGDCCPASGARRVGNEDTLPQLTRRNRRRAQLLLARIIP